MTFRPGQTSVPPKRRPSARAVKERPIRYSLPLLSSWLGLALLVGLLAWLSMPRNPETSSIKGGLLTSTLERTSSPTAQPGQTPAPPKVSKLENVLMPVIEKWKSGLGNEAEFGLVVHHLERDARFALNNQKLFETASLYKLFVMLTIYYDISQGKLSLDNPITLSAGLAADAVGDDGGALIVPVGGKMSVRDLLHAMIADSNNTASLMLLFHVKPDHMRQVVADVGFRGSDLSDTYNFQSTPEDFNLFFSRLADNKLLGPKYDAEMRDLLLRTTENDRIPRLLPPGTRVAHKPGKISGVTNDTGLVYLPDGQRVAISVMTRKANPQGAREFISQLSLAAYNYYKP